MSTEHVRRLSDAALRLLVVFALPLAGCEKEGAEREEAEEAEEAEAVSISPEARAEAQQIFTGRCTTCHGQTGQGDGPASAGLTPQPRNFQDHEWQESVANDHIERIIVYGGAAVGKSPAMSPNPDLQSKPEVVAALRQHIRSLGGGELATAE